MKKILPILLLVFPMWCMPIHATENIVDIFVMNDLHVMHPDLLQQDGTAFEYVMNNDRKMLGQSKEIFLTLIDSILLHQPDLVLIPGDLTKDGELIGHQLVAQELQRLRNAGIQTYVIPGNHDIRNAGARYFNGNNTTAAAITQASDFESIYQDFGYGNTSVRDTASLSYMVEATPELNILAIDAVQWYNNTLKSLGDSADICISQGKLKKQTLQWILDRADEAKQQGKQVIAMMHQQLLQHVTMQSQVFPTASIEQGDSIAQLLIQHGIHVIFTGHMHITNNSTYYNAERTDSIVELSTGSVVSYPCPYREITVHTDSCLMTVSTPTLQSIPSQPNFQTFAKESLGKSAENLVDSQVGNFWPIYQTILTTGKLNYGSINIDLSAFSKFLSFCPQTQTECIAIAKYHFKDVARALLFTTSEGNEPQRDSINTYIRTTIETKIQYLIDSIVDNNSCPEVIMGTNCFGSFEAGIYKNGILPYVKPMYEPALNSILEDKTYGGTAMENVTDDLNLIVLLKKPSNSSTALEGVEIERNDGQWYDILGRPVDTPSERGVYIQNGKKILIP